jgi:hypothetical protein
MTATAAGIFRGDLVSSSVNRPRVIKGNRGRAATLRLQRRVSAMGAASAVIVWMFWLLQHKYPLHPLMLLQHEMHLLAGEPADDDEGLHPHRNYHHHHHHPENRHTHGIFPEKPQRFRGQSTERGDGKHRVLDESFPTTDPAWQDVLNARIHLIELRFVPAEHEVAQQMNGNTNEVNYAGVYGIFCKLDWNLHKQDPSTYPMFRDLISNSPQCEETRVQVPFQLLMDRIRSYDATAPIHVLSLGGVVFHESRCGSTLVANLLASMSASHRVYSESSPPITAMTLGCGGHDDCKENKLAVPLLRDTMYLMQRTDNAQETHVFFKIQSAGTLHLDVFVEAFPDTPWFFVYRSPVEVMVSHLQGSLGKASIKNANCVRRQRMNPPSQVLDILERDLNTRDAMQVDPIDYCAAHLASITESALKTLHSHPHTGRAVNYQRLPDALWDDLLPNHWHLPVSAQALKQMQITSGQYSKGRQEKKGDFQGDSEHKEAIASPSLKRAAHEILESSFQELERL